VTEVYNQFNNDYLSSRDLFPYLTHALNSTRATEENAQELPHPPFKLHFLTLLSLSF